jgi:hypothetical protein
MEQPIPRSITGEVLAIGLIGYFLVICHLSFVIAHHA